MARLTGGAHRAQSLSHDKRTRRTVVRGALAGAPVVILAACSPGGPAAPSLRVDQPVTVTLLLQGSFAGPGADAQTEAYEKLFRPQHPNITINFEASGVSGTDYTAKVIAAVVAGTPPDVLYQGLAGMPALVTKGVIRPLDDLVKADKQFKADDFFPVHWNAWRFEGKHQGLPWQGGPLVMYYNKNLFDAAGASYPTEANWTWDAWRQTGSRLKRAMAGSEGRWPTEVGPWRHWLYAAGGSVLDKDAKRTVLNSPQALSGLQMMSDLVHRDQIAPRPQDIQGQGSTAQRFMEGKLGAIVMNRQGSSAEGFIQPHVVVAPLAKGPAGRYSQAPFDGFLMGAGIKSPAAAWEVLKFRCGDPLRRILHARSLAGVPALKSTAASSEYLNDRLPAEWNRFFVDQMATCRLAPPIAVWPDIEQTVGQSVTQILRGEIAVDAAVRDLVPRIEALLQQAA
jgi:multiple sugar transport system substrate-binding protein